jgi:hypothetical protein
MKKSNSAPLNVLFMMISDRWSIYEKYVLAEAEAAQTKSLNAYLYCLKDSFLDRKAKELGVKTIYHKKSVSSGVLSWARLSGIHHLIQKYDFAVIHCYQIEFLFKLAFMLRKMPTIAFFFTYLEQTKKNYRSLFHRFLMKRVDGVFVPFLEQAKDCTSKFLVPERKIHISGLPFLHLPETKDVPKLDEKQFLGKKDLPDDVFLIGLYFEQNVEEIDDFNYIFKGLKNFLLSIDPSQAVMVVLGSDFEWKERIIFQPLQLFLQEIGFPLDTLIFYQGKHYEVVLKKLSIFIDIGSSTSGFSEMGLLALKSGVPSLLPKSAFSLEIFDLRQRIGETFRVGDSWDLRVKVAQLFENNEKYKDNMDSKKDRVLDPYLPKINLEELYLRAQRKRLRFFHLE